ncbi:hypothetical protein P9C02_14610 [Bacillus paralicheniformis]|uniref:hypothetical protein n=2 Tax=Bacillaceae TaxID=186817 RepID=UPI002DB5E8BE|nr:hypothetical protein [Bacillus paralicheniformis]MEC1191725.1 hypothetical protein [Bacillus paralicheniformis]
MGDAYINAGGGTGFETYRFHKLAVSSGTGQKQAAVHKAIFNKIKGKGVKDRGEKSANFSVLRGTKMAANKNDAALLKQASFISQGTCRGHCRSSWT